MKAIEVPMEELPSSQFLSLCTDSTGNHFTNPLLYIITT